MKEALIRIKSCNECKYLDKKRHYTSDSWETAFDWFCKKANGKKIEGYVGWNEEKGVEIPKWCPISSKVVDLAEMLDKELTKLNTPERYDTEKGRYVYSEQDITKIMNKLKGKVCT